MARTKIANSQLSFTQGSGYIKIGTILMQWGETATPSGGVYQTFPIAFSTTPKVMTNLNDPGSQDCRAYNISTTGCTLRQNYTASSLGVQWLAIGDA